MGDENPRATLADLSGRIGSCLADRLLGLYLFGSLATGDFVPGRSDIDLCAVLESDIADDDDLASLRELHEHFESERPEWRDRIEALYISRTALASFASEPRGSVARISPGEPMHRRDLDGNIGWLLDWHAVVGTGEVLLGLPPLMLGPAVDDGRFREAVISQLRDLRQLVRQNEVAYVPAQQGYIAATACRALYSLVHGRQTSKQIAVEWAIERYPEWGEWLDAAYGAYRADVRRPHERLIRFVDEIAAESGDIRPD